MNDAGHSFGLGGASRVPALRSYLDELRTRADGEDTLMRLIEWAADPRDFIGEPEKNQAVLDHLNLYLEYDDLEVVLEG